MASLPWLRSDEEWEQWCLGPGSGYNETDWVSISSRFLSFDDARAVVRRLGLKSRRAWMRWNRSGKRPRNIPSNPDQTYGGKGWVSWLDWMGYIGRTGAKSSTCLLYTSDAADE